jgi:hypothetical protein
MDFTAVPDGRGVRYPQTPTHADRRNQQLEDARQLRVVQAVADFLPNGVRTRSRSTAMPAVDADSCQADYFLRLLVQNCRQLNHRIDKYQREIAIAETRGAVQRARGIRRVMRIEEHERQTVQRLIECLQRRFPLGSDGEVRSHSPERRLMAR